ncbi:MAG TPA: glycosyltransferase family 2 protein [Acidimicrobiia bacterium]
MSAARVTPRIRVVVVDYNGGDLTIDCLEHLVASDHPADALDLVLVDNGSQDSVAKRVRAELPSVRVVQSAENRGFAGGCNLGIGDLRDVDHIALVNSDATVSPGWLRPLLEALDQDPMVGAASPKILLARRYRAVDISVPTARRRGDRRDLGVRVTGARIGDEDVWREVRFPAGTFGPELDRDGTELCWTTATARVLVPASASSAAPLELRLDAPGAVEVTFTVEGRRTSARVSSEPGWCAVPGDGAPFDVVNNVGTRLVEDGYAADRGWLEQDHGQYERPEDVFAWCGAAVLLRADYLRDVGTFDERLFLYSEDVELAWRGLGRGWRHRYVPGSVVRHVHAATAQRSTRTGTLKERNRLLVLVRHARPGLVARALLRYVLVTGSYARRDLLEPARAGAPVRPAVVSRRVRAFGGFLRWAPAMVRSRRADRRRARPRPPRAG